MARLFVALRPPATVRERLLEAMDDDPGIRWQDDEQLHLTLAFLGEVERRAEQDLADALAAVDSPPFELEIRGVGHFERKGMASALWAGLAPSEPLARLQQRVVAACRRAGLEPDGKAFRPHVTLARLNRSSPPAGHWLAAHGTLRSEPWVVREFALYESRLSPGGSLYEALVSFSLRP
jgi:2'-5' RNA ligase